MRKRPTTSLVRRPSCTDVTLIEEYLNNVDPKEMTKVLPLSEYLFKQAGQLWTRLITSCVKNRHVQLSTWDWIS